MERKEEKNNKRYEIKIKIIKSSPIKKIRQTLVKGDLSIASKDASVVGVAGVPLVALPVHKHDHRQLPRVARH